MYDDVRDRPKGCYIHCFLESPEPNMDGWIIYGAKSVPNWNPNLAPMLGEVSSNFHPCAWINSSVTSPRWFRYRDGIPNSPPNSLTSQRIRWNWWNHLLQSLKHPLKTKVGTGRLVLRQASGQRLVPPSGSQVGWCLGRLFFDGWGPKVPAETERGREKTPQKDR